MRRPLSRAPVPARTALPWQLLPGCV